MRCYAAARTVTTVPGATAGPQLEASTAHPFYLLECGVFNTTTTAFNVSLNRYTVGGTAGAAITEVAEDDTFTPLTTATGVNSTASTVGGPFTMAEIGAAIGAGVIWTFGGKGLRIPGTTDNGATLIVPNGTGQHFDFYWVWEE
jgi:hypothetical protein